MKPVVEIFTKIAAGFAFTLGATAAKELIDYARTKKDITKDKIETKEETTDELI